MEGQRIDNAVVRRLAKELAILHVSVTAEHTVAEIKLLDDALVDQIAAGEVVERPSSVVKELLENALDASAEAITVEIAEGGRESIRVVDDGSGMDRADAELCVRRHATSKIASLEDLQRLVTMGFRGEALASIASVSRFRLVTRQRTATAGIEVVIEGGSPPTVREVGAPPGTSLEVRDLFFNVPARRKFLKARQTESHHIAETCLKIALAHPHVRLALFSNGRRVREYLPAKDRVARARSVFPDLALEVVDAERDGVRMLAALGPPERARTGARNLYLYVNDRPIVDRGLARAIAFAYGDKLSGGQFPSGAVFLDLDPDAVDVNAHPQKTEVRFAKASIVYDAVTRMLTKGLGTKTWEGGITGSASVASGPASRDDDYWKERLAPGPTVEKVADDASSEPDPWGLGDALREESPAYADEPTESAPDEPMRFLGVVGSLWLATHRDHLLAIEPCRAAGALTLESWTGDELPSQRLLFPERVELTDVEMSRIEVHRDELDELGIECASVGPRSIAIHSVPRLPTVLVCEPRAEDLLRAALLAFENGVDARAAMASAATVRVSDECAADVIAILTQWPPAKRADFIAAWSGVDLRARLP